MVSLKPPREWGWYCIIFGLIFFGISWVADGRFPSVLTTVCCAALVLFGIFVRPSIKLIAGEDDIRGDD